MPIERLAARNIQAMDRFQTTGPYRLAGYLSGGLVAYEMAYQLLASDRAVDFVGLLDSPRSRGHPGNGYPDTEDAVAHRYYSQPLPITVHLFVASPDKMGGVREWQAVAGDKLQVVSSEAGLATALEQKLHSTATAEPPKMMQSHVPPFPVQVGRRHVRPIFCVPGAGANVTSFMALAESLGEQATVYGLQPRGLDGGGLPHATVGLAAKSYIEILRRSAPRGPYRLLGHSFGGWVVFEMACQLAAVGDLLDPVVLLDCQPPTEKLAAARFLEHTDTVMKLVWLLEESGGKPLGISRRDLEQLDYDAQQLKLMQSMKSVGQYPQAAKIASIKTLMRVFNMHVNTTYVPAQSFQGEVLLLQAGEPSVRHGPEDDDDLDNESATRSWSTYARRLIRAVVPGNHMTILKSPNIAAVAARIRAIWPDQ
jgi:thioesterase domain-containing protein